VIETAQADEASAGPSAAKAPEASADVSTLRTAKPVGRPAAPRRVVRGSPESGEQQQDLPHRLNGNQPTTGTSHGAATAGSSSGASSSVVSSSPGSNSSGIDSSDSDASES